MTYGVQKEIDREYLGRFFHDHKIDEFAAVSPSSLTAPPGRTPGDLLPGCRTLILFGLTMGDDLFVGTHSETSPRVTRFKHNLNSAADDLISVLKERGSTAVAVRDVTVADGIIRGDLSLKHCARDAGLGSLGDSTLFLSPRFGNRLSLAAVLTDSDFAPYPDIASPGDLCHHCGNCVHSCPEHAIFPGSVEAIRCRNVTGGIPSFLRPFVGYLFQSSVTAPLLTPIVNRIAKTSTPRCSACLMACPHFHKGDW